MINFEEHGFKWYPDENAWEYYKEFSEPTEGGEFEYEIIEYYKDPENDDWIFSAGIKRSTGHSESRITLVNPDDNKIRESIKLLGINKTL